MWSNITRSRLIASPSYPSPKEREAVSDISLRLLLVFFWLLFNLVITNNFMIVVTGGTGLVGSHLLLELAKKGIRVRALKRNTSDLKVFEYIFSSHKVATKTIEWVEADIIDINSLEEHLQSTTQVYHCAAMISFAPHEAKKMLHSNIEGTANIVNTCLKFNVRKLCYVSSVASLGRNTANGIIDEETHWQSSSDNSNYAISKYGAEREVWRGIAEGLNAVIVNPSIILGAGNWNNGSSRMFQQVWNGLHFYTKGVTGFVDVSDVVNIMIELMNSEISGERFLLNAENISYQDFFIIVAKLFNKKEPAIYATPFIGELAWRTEVVRQFFLNHQPLITKETARTAHKKYFYSNEKIKKALGYKFKPLDETLNELCKLFLEEKNLSGLLLEKH